MRIKALAILPNGIVRGIQYNTTTNKATWVVKKDKLYAMPGKIEVTTEGVLFHPDKDNDLQWIMNEYVPTRETYGPIYEANTSLRVKLHRKKYYNRLKNLDNSEVMYTTLETGEKRRVYHRSTKTGRFHYKGNRINCSIMENEIELKNDGTRLPLERISR